MGPEFKGTKCSYFVDLFVIPLLWVDFYLLQMFVDFDALAAGFGFGRSPATTMDL